jgi:glycosyltransferase involved in cell wall biosynthesis
MFYPGRRRVGRTDGALSLPDVPIFNGLDWYWGLSAVRAWRFMRRVRPRVVVLHWWTATVLHSYVVLAWLARRAGARIVIEFHEAQDVGEARLPLVSRYTRAGMRLMLSLVDAVAVHSEFDRLALSRTYPQISGLPSEVVTIGPFGNHVPQGVAPKRSKSAAAGESVRLLIFGVVRPYKGHSELAEAARLLRESGIDVHVTAVGEVWQGYRQPLDELAAVLPSDRLDIVDRFVADDEVPDYFAAADLLVLPYRRSSASGPLLTAMAWGLPVVTTAVGGLVEASEGYSGAVLVPPCNPQALADGIRSALPLVGITHVDPNSWAQTAQEYVRLFNRIGVNWGRDGREPADRSAGNSFAGGIA